VLSTSGGSYRYTIDYGAEFQGHVNVSFLKGKPGQRITLRMGEQLLQVKNTLHLCIPRCA